MSLNEALYLVCAVATFFVSFTYMCYTMRAKEFLSEESFLAALMATCCAVFCFLVVPVALLAGLGWVSFKFSKSIFK